MVVLVVVLVVVLLVVDADVAALVVAEPTVCAVDGSLPFEHDVTINSAAN